MPDNKKIALVEQATVQLRMFFPDTVFTGDEITNGIQNDEIIVAPDKMLRYLQSALLDEKIVEIKLDNAPKTYFARLHDHPPSPDELELETEEIEDVPYTKGDYLHKLNHLISLPLEPGMGNPTLRRSGTIILRVLTNNYIIEFGTFYESIVYVDEVPMLQLSFPSIGRIIKENREFRAQVPENLSLTVTVQKSKSRPKFSCLVNNVSPTGIGFSVERDQYKLLKVDDVIVTEIYLEKELLLTVTGAIQHLHKMRKGKTIQYICGMHLRLESLANTSIIEALVAKVQRAHLQDITHKSDRYGVQIII